MSDFSQVTTQDLWNDGRQMTITAVKSGSTSLVLTWTLPTPIVAYDGAVVLLSTKPFNGYDRPIDGTKYTPSSNWTAPADMIGETAQVVAAFYGYFGDSTTTTTVTVTNLDPDTIYYASIHACSNVLQYYPIGCQSYPLQADTETKLISPYAGSVPTAVVAPENPTPGQAYFDPSTNSVYVWNDQQGAWVRADQATIRIGEELPVTMYQLFYNSSLNQLLFFDGLQFVEATAENLQVKMGPSTYVPFAGIMANSGLPPDPVTGQFVFSTRQAAISAPPVSKIYFYSLASWLLPTPDLVQVLINDVWCPIAPPGINNFYGPWTPEVPSVGQFFYLTTTKRLMSWSGEEWVAIDTAERGTPTTDKLGIGTSDNYAARLQLINTVKNLMGYPSVCVELTEDMFNTGVNNALTMVRQRTDNAYAHRHISFTLYGGPNGGQQNYYLNDPRDKTDKIVNVLKIHRINQLGISSLSAETGLYAQAFYNQLYQGSNVDVLSIHLMNQLSKTYEKIFAGNLMFTWDEATRELYVLRRALQAQERVVLEVVMEREEAELINDRWLKLWIQNWTYAEMLETLGLIRSKYGTLPGANGGLTLNGDTLLSMADAKKMELRRQIDDFEIGNGGPNVLNAAFMIG